MLEKINASARDNRSDLVHWHKFAAGDDNALALLFEQKHLLFHGIACRIVGNMSDADDVLQASMEKLLTSKIDKNIDSVQAWLIRVVINQALSFKRRESRLRDRHKRASESEDYDVSLDSPTDRFERNEQIRLIYDVIDQLPERYRDPIVMRFIDGLSYKEIAQQLDRKEQTVKKQAQRAMSMVRCKCNN